MSRPIFEFKDYKSYLGEVVGPPRRRTGAKAAIARAIRCQATYVSRVLHGCADLSLEQGQLLAEHLGLTSEEKHYFLLLIQRERAGNKALEQYFEEQLDQIRARRLTLTGRLGQDNALSSDQRSRYYSSWLYGAIHMAVTLPELRTVRAIAAFLNLTPKRVGEVLEGLVEMRLITKQGDEFLPGTAQMRLGNASHDIIKHHTNWRNQAIESLDRERLEELHYSAVVSLSRADAIRVKDRFLEFIRETLQIVKDSPEEELRCICLDFFDLRKGRP